MSEVNAEIFAALVKSHDAQLDYIRQLEVVVEALKKVPKEVFTHPLMAEVGGALAALES